MIGMCLDGYALEEVESMKQRMSFSPLTSFSFICQPEYSHFFFQISQTVEDREAAVSVITSFNENPRAGEDISKGECRRLKNM